MYVFAYCYICTDISYNWLAYLHACGRMLTSVYIQISAATGWHNSMRCGYQIIETHRQRTGTRYIQYHTFVLILVYTALLLPFVLILIILLYMCPTIYVSSYYFICPDTTLFVFSCLMPYALCLCLMPHASCLMPHALGGTRAA